MNEFWQAPAERNKALDELRWCFCGAYESLDQVFSLAQMVKDIPGDLVECGIASGSGITAMKMAVPDKTVWGYDSFEGIQLAGPHDTEQPGKDKIEHNVNVPSEDLLKSSGVTVCSYDWVVSRLESWGYKEEDFKLIKGWVQHTLPTIKPKKIALLRLDMDIYEPTYFALKELWPRLSRGGVLLIDDWGLKGVERACEKFFSEIGYTPEWHIMIGFNPRFIVK